MTKPHSELSGTLIPRDAVDRLFDPPKYLSAEDKKIFAGHYQNIFHSVQPENWLERTSVYLITNCFLEILKIQNEIASLIANARHKGIRALLSGRITDDEYSLVDRHRLGEAKAVKDVTAYLEKFGLTDADIDAHTSVAIYDQISPKQRKLDQYYDQLDRYCLNFEKRRLLIVERLRRYADIPVRPKSFSSPRSDGGSE